MNITKSTMAIPAVTRRSAPNPNKGKSKYDFAGLQAGESLIFTDEGDTDKLHSRLVSAVASYRKRSGDTRKLLVRTFTQDDNTQAVGVFMPAEVAADAAE